jgi:hypothetical protein
MGWLDWLRAREARGPDGGDELFDEAFQRKLEYLAVASRRLFAGASGPSGARRIRAAGIEFADHREYTPATTCAPSTGTSTAAPSACS